MAVPASPPPTCTQMAPFFTATGPGFAGSLDGWDPNATTKNPMAAIDTTNATAIVATRRRGAVDVSSHDGCADRRCRPTASEVACARWSMSAQRSGLRFRSSCFRRSDRSSIMNLQQIPQSLATAVEVHPDGSLAEAEDRGDLIQRIAGVVVENNRGSLPIGQRRERENEFRRLWPRHDVVGQRFVPASSLHLCGRDPKGDSPQPSG